MIKMSLHHLNFFVRRRILGLQHASGNRFGPAADVQD
jgi:hypothetical protein